MLQDWADALHYDTPGATYGKCAGNAKLVDLAKAGAWKRGVREEIDVEEWPFKPDLFKEAYVLQVGIRSFFSPLHFPRHLLLQSFFFEGGGGLAFPCQSDDSMGATSTQACDVIEDSCTTSVNLHNTALTPSLTRPSPAFHLVFRLARMLRQVPWGFLGDNHVFGTSAPNVFLTWA